MPYGGQAMPHTVQAVQTVGSMAGLRPKSSVGTGTRTMQDKGTGTTQAAVPATIPVTMLTPQLRPVNHFLADMICMSIVDRGVSNLLARLSRAVSPCTICRSMQYLSRCHVVRLLLTFVLFGFSPSRFVILRSANPALRQIAITTHRRHNKARTRCLCQC
jgi:hypothetical protein